MLGIHNDKEKEFEKVLNRLRPNQIDSMGRLMEWAAQEKELTPDMVHTSHLWAVYPGDEIAWNKDRDLFDACLLYTSDAADDLICVDFGGGRSKKKKR